MDSYTQQLIECRDLEGDQVKAFQVIFEGKEPNPCLHILHQCNCEWHLWKSEVAELTVLAESPFDQFEHRVDSAIKRDVIVAKKPTN